MDITASYGTELYSPIDGTATFYQRWRQVGDSKMLVSYGNYVEVTDGTYTIRICHMSEFNQVAFLYPDAKSPAECYGAGKIDGTCSIASWNKSTDHQDPCAVIPVKKGQYLGKSGSSGRSTGPHLHVTLLRNGVTVEPYPYFDDTVAASTYYNNSDYVPANTCTCSTSYKGLYKCTTASSPLTIRNGHSKDHGKLGYIPSGARVVVTLANGSWAHVQYDGIHGYASMQYLSKVGDLSSVLQIDGYLLDYLPGDTFKVNSGSSLSAARQFADYCQTIAYGECITLVPEGFSVLNGSDKNKLAEDMANPGTGWVATLTNGSIYVVEDNDGSTIKLLSLGSGNVIKRTTMTKAQAREFFTQNPVSKIEMWSHCGLGGGGSAAPDDVSSTVTQPEIIIHIDSPKGKYDGSNHIEISGWIASMHSVTYIMGECEAFGQMNLTGSITDASAELNAAGYSGYPYKIRYRSVIDRKYLQPNTTYTMKVWAGMTNGVTSGVCGQRFDVTSIVPTVINITSPSGSSFAGGKDVTVAGYIQSLNPITDVAGKIADINGSSQVLNFDLSLTANSSVASSTYPYGYSFSGVMPLALVTASNTTATVFVTTTDENNIQKTEPKTFVIGSVVRGDINAYEFVYNQEYVRIYNQDTQTLSGTVHANAPIADVMAQIYQWANNGGIIITTANVRETTPKSGYQYAKTFELKVSAGDLCDILGVDSFTDNEFRVLFWCDLVGSDGKGVHLESGERRTVYGNNVQMVNYTVKYNANGGTGGPTASQTFKHNKGVTLSSAVPTRAGYNFRGWTTSATSNEVKYVPGSTYSTNSNVTLYAVWQKAIDIPTNLANYDLSAAVTIKNAAKVYKFVPSAETKYRFTASGSAGANVVIQNASGATVDSLSGASSVSKEVLLNDNTVYYIVVKPNTANATGTVNVNVRRSYEITFDANGGTGAPADALYQFSGEKVTLPTAVPTIDPITISFVADAESRAAAVTHECPVLFEGWSNSDYRSYSIWESGESAVFDRSLTLQAEWNHQSLNDLGIYEIPEKEGMIFCGWADENGYIVDPDTVALEDETYYAQWISATPLEGLKVTPRTMNLEVGDVAQLMVSPIPAEAHLPELTWTSSNPDTATVSQTGVVTICAEGASTITVSCDEGLRATATVIVGSPVFTVSYDANGGTGTVPTAVTLNHGDAYKIPGETPSRGGYTFLGWAKRADAAAAEWQPGEDVNVEMSMTLYAVWNANSYQVCYDANGGTGAPEAQTKIHGETLPLSSVLPTREGYSFGGWALKPTAAKADYFPGDSFMKDADVTLYALWRAKATGVALNYPALVLNVGESASLRPVFQPADANGGAVIWSSSNEQVAVVVNGKVSAVSAGSATITCTVADNTDLKAACKVTVVKGASQDGNAPDAPETQQITALPGQDVQVNLKFNSVNAAFAKLLFSYDTNALTLTNVSANGTHVTLGTNVVVMAVSNGKIPDGVQAVLSFTVAQNAEPGVYTINTVVTECYTIDEEDSDLYAVAVDRVNVACPKHIPVLMEAPVPASRTENGISAEVYCEICGSCLAQQQEIRADRCYWLPAELRIIDEEAMAGLTMQQVVVPDNVQSIESGAFRNCKELLIVMIPADVQEIASDAFDGCDMLCIVAEDGSYAQTYAQENNIPCRIR